MAGPKSTCSGSRGSIAEDAAHHGGQTQAVTTEGPGMLHIVAKNDSPVQRIAVARRHIETAIAHINDVAQARVLEPARNSAEYRRTSVDRPRTRGHPRGTPQLRVVDSRPNTASARISTRAACGAHRVRSRMHARSRTSAFARCGTFPRVARCSIYTLPMRKAALLCSSHPDRSTRGMDPGRRRRRRRSRLAGVRRRQGQHEVLAARSDQQGHGQESADRLAAFRLAGRTSPVVP